MQFDQKFSISVTSYEIIITTLKTKSSQKVDTCEYKIHAGSDGNLMPIMMYKTLFPPKNTMN